MKAKQKAAAVLTVLALGVGSGAFLSVHFAGEVNGLVSRNHLARAEKFMDQMNYEQAVIAFQAAIEIEPKQAEAYLGLAEAYRKMQQPEAAAVVLADGYQKTQEREILKELEDIVNLLYDSYVEAGEYDKAEEILELLYEATGDQEVKERLEEMKRLEEARQTLGMENAETLSKLYEALSDNDLQRAETLIKGLDFSKVLTGTDGKLIYPLGTEGEKTMAVYSNQAVYFGAMAGGEREGYGLWIKSDASGSNIYEGNWSDDAPEGKGTVTFTKLSGTGAVIYRAVTDGTFAGGRENGSMKLVHEQNGEVNTFEYTAQEGRVLPMNGQFQQRGNSQYVAAVSIEHSENEFVTTSSEEYGVYGFITGNAFAPGG